MKLNEKKKFFGSRQAILTYYGQGRERPLIAPDRGHRRRAAVKVVYFWIVCCR